MTRKHPALGLATIAALCVAGCKTDLTAINIDPNNPTTAPVGAVFTQAAIGAVSVFSGTRVTLSMTSLFAQHIAQVQYIDEDRGHISAGAIDGLFAGGYRSGLIGLGDVKAKGVAATAPAVWGPATVMQAWVYQNMTDIWGDIPYRDALSGDRLGDALVPAYDGQKDIYYGLLAELTAASTAMKSAAGGAGLGTADVIYSGDLARWQRFANTLRARIALRMLKNDPAKAAAELSAAISAGLLASNADNASLVWPGDGTFDNPLSRNFASRDDHRVSKTLVDTLNALQDPRLTIFAQPTKADPTLFAGLQNGLDNQTVSQFFNTTSRPGAVLYPGATTYGVFGTIAGRATPSYLATYAEAEFILAEAAERGLAGVANAAGHYRAAVSASVEQWGGTGIDAAAYLLRPGVAYGGGAEGLRQIGLQKWIAFFTQSIEAWSEWRRTGNPATIRMGPKAYSDVTEVPRRIPYPNSEFSVNAVHVNEAIARQGPNLYSTRMWWDK